MCLPNVNTHICYLWVKLKSSSWCFPIRDCALGSSRGAAFRQCHRLHIVVQGGWFDQLDEHYVVVSGPGVILGMVNDFGGDELLIAFSDLDVTLTRTNLYTTTNDIEMV